MENIGIIGFGLIGGSIAKAMKKRNDFKIYALSRSIKPLIKGFNDKIIDKYSDNDLSIFKDCDIIFICTPVDKITEFVDKLIPYIKKDCIITDVGSTKKHIYEQMHNYKDIIYIGGHPMAGSEQIGYNSAKEYLFENAYYILTPSLNVPKEKIDSLVNILEILGAIPVIISAQYHDYITASISHVPHIVSAALVNMVKKLDGNDKYMHTLAAGGFKDLTRISSSSPEMWKSICIENKDEILNIIEEFKEQLNKFENYIESENNIKIFNLFENAKKYRDTFSNNKKSVISKSDEVLIDVYDKPGIIATIATMLSVNNINIKNIGIVNSREYENGILQIVFDDEKDKEKSIKLLKDMNFIVYDK